MSHPRKELVSEEEFLYSDEPTEAAMFKEAHPGHHTVCQTLRDIYALTDTIVQDGDTPLGEGEPDPVEEIKVKLRLAWAMMKAMNDRLHYYKNKYEPERKHA